MNAPARSYNLNAEAAKQADSMGNRITETGKYIGTFTRAEAINSKKGTEGIEFTFATNSGQSADFLTLWTFNTDGKELFGLKTLNALMTCMRVKTMAPTQGQVEKWDNGQKVKVMATLFPDLMGKQVGVLLQREPYEKQDGTTGYKFNIFAAFDAQSEMMASEILDKAGSPEKLGKLVATLQDRPMQKQAAGAAPAASGGAGRFDDMADDIPF